MSRNSTVSLLLIDFSNEKRSSDMTQKRKRAVSEAATRGMTLSPKAEDLSRALLESTEGKVRDLGERGRHTPVAAEGVGRLGPMERVPPSRRRFLEIQRTVDTTYGD